MAELVDFDPRRHEGALRELWTAYIAEAVGPLKEQFGIEQEVPAVIAGMMSHLDDFAPPTGRLLLVVEAGWVLGCGCLRPIAPGIAEVKRMYLVPSARGQGLGRVLLTTLLSAARAEGYREARLDTGGCMTD